MTNEKKGAGQPEHDPKLQMAALEITEILKKHNIAGVLALHNQSADGTGRLELVIKIDPSYSCVSIDSLKKLNITPPLEDPQNPNASKKIVADTINMLANLSFKLNQVNQVLTQSIAGVRIRFGLMPKPGDPKIKPLNGNNFHV